MIGSRKLSVLGTALALFGCGAPLPTSPTKIIGGVESGGRYSMAVGVVVMPDLSWLNTGVCTGAVVSDRLVMMAAHCVQVERARPKNTVATIFDKFAGSDALRRDAFYSSSLLAFPGWNPLDGDHLPDNADVAFAVFPRGSFPKGSARQIAHVVTTSVSPGQSVALVGYGDAVWADPTSNPELKRLVGTNTVSAVDANHAGLITIVTSRVGETSAGGAAGDSGSPLLNDQGEIVGIAHTAWNVTEQDGNGSISVATPHITTFTNVADPGIACFIRAVLTAPDPGPQTGRECRATPTKS